MEKPFRLYVNGRYVANYGSIVRAKQEGKRMQRLFEAKWKVVDQEGYTRASSENTEGY